MSSKKMLWSEGPNPRLIASRLRSSGEIVFPQIPDHSPLADNYVDQHLEDVGMIYSYTVIHPSPKSGLQPFPLAYLDLPGPVRLFGRVNTTRSPVIGDSCRVVPDDVYGYAFEFVEGA
tara:strand:+ start:6025 stop:6378 length:354 start_codon:yes stop_codon:yes gene_type:complete